MGYGVGWDFEHRRWRGYDVPAYCDAKGCTVEIDRGLGYVCECPKCYDEEDPTGVTTFVCGSHTCDDVDWSDVPEHPDWIGNTPQGLDYTEADLHPRHPDRFRHRGDPNTCDCGVWDCPECGGQKPGAPCITTAPRHPSRRDIADQLDALDLDRVQRGVLDRVFDDLFGALA